MANEPKQTESKKTTKKSPSQTMTPRKTTKKAPAKQPSAAQSAPKSHQKQSVTPLERWRMVAESAYYRAEARGFLGGNPIEDWLEAEREIDARYTVDLGKVMTVFDPSEMIKELAKAFSGVELPGVDLNAVLEAQRKNVEALTVANQRAFDAAQEMVGRQLEMLREAMTEATAALSVLSATKSPTQAAVKQGEILKQLMERALINLREMTEFITKANANAFDLIRKRVEVSLQDIKTASKLPQPK